MNNPRLDAAVSLLKQSKAEGKTYYDATQVLAKQGFSPAEIDDASHQFAYSDISAPNDGNAVPSASLNQAFAEAVVNEEAIDSVRQDLHNDSAVGLFGGRSIFGRYYRAKAVSDYAALKNLEQSGQAYPTDPNNPSGQNGTRVYQRNRAVKYYAFLAMLPIVFVALNALVMLGGVAKSAASGHNYTGRDILSLFIGPLFVCGLFGGTAAVLFLARKESTIRNSIYLMLGLELVTFVLLTIITRSASFIIVGILVALPGFWISRRVGMLSQLR